MGSSPDAPFLVRVSLRLPHIIICSLDAIAVLHAGFGLESGPIHLDNVACTGSELALVNCTHDSVTTDCSHIEDAGVHCSLTCMYSITGTHKESKNCCFFLTLQALIYQTVGNIRNIDAFS